MGVNWNEIQFVILDFFTSRFAHGKIENTRRSSHLIHVVWSHDPVKLCSWAEQVFRAQPTRLFLYGYIIVSELTELWFFSRVGIYRSRPILPEQLTIQQLQASYDRMTDFQFGLNPLICTDEFRHKCIFVKGLGKLESCLSDSPRKYKLRLDKDPIICPREIVCDRPTCYRARDDYGGEFAIKFSLNKAQIFHEERLLRRVTERKIWGVAQLVDFQTIEASPFTSSCIVTSPFARDLESYESIAELMQCFRDAIKGHYWLYHVGKILHRDISLGNIMITNNYKSNPDAPCGILIDLDRSLDLETEPKKPYHLQGTKAFMAIDISRPYNDHILHTYRHDLESFFYVFLYLAVCRNKRLPKTSRLTRWMDAKKDWAETGRMKLEDMSDNENFNAIIGEFDPRFKQLESLARKLREFLFLSEDEFFVGTKTEKDDVDKLYRQIIDAFARWAERLDQSRVRW